MVNLPRTVALKSKYNNNYLRYVKETSQVHSFLQYSGDNVLTPYTKFEIEQAKCDPSLVNIRCCYNNKYWVSKSPTEYWIVAGADKTEEDKTKWNCTLFQPIYDSVNKAFRFRNVYLGNNVCLMRVEAPYGDCLIAQWSDPDRDHCDLCSIIDWDTLLSIPKFVAFKGDNGKYLQFYWNGYHQYMQFSSSDILDSHVVIETFITKDGNIRFKSFQNGLFWRRSPNWIWADSNDTTTSNLDTVFSPVKLNKDVIALRNLGNNYFIRRLTTDGKTDCLNAATPTIDKYSQLQLMEPLVSREIYNVNFHPIDSRIYDQCVLVMATESASNRTQAPSTMNLKFTYTDTKSSMWTSSASLKLGVKTTLQTKFPYIVDGKIELSGELSGSHQWGETTTTSKTLETTYQVTVPPMTMVVVSLIATNGKGDVPFSYTQRDTLFNGNTKIYEMDDGVCTCINNYNFTYETKSKPLTV